MTQRTSGLLPVQSIPLVSESSGQHRIERVWSEVAPCVPNSYDSADFHTIDTDSHDEGLSRSPSSTTPTTRRRKTTHSSLSYGTSTVRRCLFSVSSVRGVLPSSVKSVSKMDEEALTYIASVFQTGKERYSIGKLPSEVSADFFAMLVEREIENLDEEVVLELLKRGARFQGEDALNSALRLHWSIQSEMLPLIEERQFDSETFLYLDHLKDANSVFKHLLWLRRTPPHEALRYALQTGCDLEVIRALCLRGCSADAVVKALESLPAYYGEEKRASVGEALRFLIEKRVIFPTKEIFLLAVLRDLPFSCLTVMQDKASCAAFVFVAEQRPERDAVYTLLLQRYCEMDKSLCGEVLIHLEPAQDREIAAKTLLPHLVGCGLQELYLALLKGMPFSFIRALMEKCKLEADPCAYILTKWHPDELSLTGLFHRSHRRLSFSEALPDVPEVPDTVPNQEV